MKVSIITATYNSADTIRECMDSILNQNYSNIEYIIIDGDSIPRDKIDLDEVMLLHKLKFDSLQASSRFVHFLIE